MSDYKSTVRAHAEKMVKLFQEILFTGADDTRLTTSDSEYGSKLRILDREMDDIANKFGVSIRQLEADVEQEVEHRSAAVIRAMEQVDQTVQH